jgi:DNA-binding winged helix-turn-helix (wHTH) protein
MRDKAPVTVGGRAFDTLGALAEVAGETVSKDTLLHKVWPAISDRKSPTLHSS